MTLREVIRDVWSPGDRAVEHTSSDGQPPTTETYTIPNPDVGRHRLQTTALALATLAVGPLALLFGTGWAPPALLAPITLTAGLLLHRPAVIMILSLGVISAALTWIAHPHPLHLLIVAGAGLLALRLVYLRDGIGWRGDRLVADLKAQLRQANQLPALGKGWERGLALQAAPGELFSGDFLVSAREGNRLKLALVDVSGKGQESVSHALMLSAAFRGLLTSVSTEDFLPACNDYLTRREELLVTAVTVDLDLKSGRYTVRRAGHPPAAQYVQGSGAWRLSPATGIALGVVTDASWTSAEGTLAPGDALMLVTNGLWGPRVDPDTGMDRVLAHAETLIRGGLTNKTTAALVKEIGVREDDAALVLLRRRPVA